MNTYISNIYRNNEKRQHAIFLKQKTKHFHILQEINYITNLCISYVLFGVKLKARSTAPRIKSLIKFDYVQLT